MCNIRCGDCRVCRTHQLADRYRGLGSGNGGNLGDAVDKFSLLEAVIKDAPNLSVIWNAVGVGVMVTLSVNRYNRRTYKEGYMGGRLRYV